MAPRRIKTCPAILEDRTDITLPTIRLYYNVDLYHTHTHTHTQHGADINLLDMEKHSPLFYARSAGHQDCVNILLANNCNDNQSPGSSDTGSIEVLQAPVM